MMADILFFIAFLKETHQRVQSWPVADVLGADLQVDLESFAFVSVCFGVCTFVPNLQTF